MIVTAKGRESKPASCRAARVLGPSAASLAAGSSASGVDLVDVTIRAAEVTPGGSFRALDGGQELHAGRLHTGARLLGVVHPETHHGSGAEEGVELVLGAPHLHLRVVWEGEAGELPSSRTNRDGTSRLNRDTPPMTAGSPPA